MSDSEMIRNYLKSLMKFLSRLDKEDADDVMREIECHIYDVIEIQKQNGQPVNAQALLEGFGRPRDLASKYVDHILDGAPPPKGFKAIQHVKKGATKGLYFATGFFGYIMSITLLGVGIYKTIDPKSVGLWANETGNYAVVGILSEAPVGTQEMLGWWIIPFAVGLGIGGAYLTNRVLSVLKPKM